MKSIKEMLQRLKSLQNDELSKANNSIQDEALSTDLIQNIDCIKTALGTSDDVVVRKFKTGDKGNIQIAVVYIDGLVDRTLVSEHIFENLMLDLREAKLNVTKMNVKDVLKNFDLSVGELKEIHNFRNLFNHVLSGDTVLLVNKISEAIAFGTKGWDDRGVTEPSAQTVVRGPKDGFSETLRTNTSLIRRRIKDTNLRFETRQIGRITKTDVTISYIKGIASEKIITEVRQRLDRIDIDSILEGGYIEELIQDQTATPFPTVYNSERPDTISAGLLEGQIAIIVDGTPFVLLVPALFIQFFHASEDFYHRTDVVIAVRILRFIAFFLSLLTPAAYVAITTFHQEMIPTPLLISLASQREGTPFPAIVEAMVMITAFEILHEAGIRMPRAIGSAISIVGALVLGEAAVQAGLVSPVMVIVVSLTAISSFVSPSFNMGLAIRLIRIVLMILASLFGLFGIIVGLIAMVLHLCSLRSFGIPYMAPFGPFILQDQSDAILRFPLWKLTKRPGLVNQTNIVRQQDPKKARPTPPPTQ